MSKQNVVYLDNMFQLKKYQTEYSGVVFRTHSLLDLLDLQYVAKAVESKEDFYIETSTILSTYQGHTIFSLFMQQPEVYEQIYTQFAAMEHEEELNSH